MKQAILVLWVLCHFAHSQPPLFRNFEYVERYSQVALDQMLEFKIPASVIMAQAILESRSGTSELALRANNHFGIKCHQEWAGDTVLKDDDTLSECFRSYTDVISSYTDHSRFLISRPRYAALFGLQLTDYAGWCEGLKTAGYATAANYAKDLRLIIENLKLYTLDAAQPLQPRSVANEEPMIRPSALQDLKPNLYQLARKELLFCDERDIHICSLRLVAR